ncbi:hypothetical protein ABB37_02899 [Leptomonas pyrrhocoris]|uniref:Uncharacterized protein n=1 Tax=Leptomonas pyrrhocoris TaxID=157538 RepID=A0A0M9G6F7_LEPPY|nr:hypothetical protein ABB37_02899 [Leptomonas pyrrhocoris]XP_015661655.1 hypothetical protein ABB37_02899 [Leptomonas pyrrhocoris]KPA83215.1 hypothetical protein ABB37_02899 [Leptomonas pyrrhocoris]KPA83216.1 hypothetical protein ABB37_02899 [Leptomonas pyrrhocoris]|eukprot:XP_015661654.1 hypothetical protein ABB37_02899 [Leptomonas pyrrhocoris]
MKRRSASSKEYSVSPHTNTTSPSTTEDALGTPESAAAVLATSPATPPAFPASPAMGETGDSDTHAHSSGESTASPSVPAVGSASPPLLVHVLGTSTSGNRDDEAESSSQGGSERGGGRPPAKSSAPQREREFEAKSCNSRSGKAPRTDLSTRSASEASSSDASLVVPAASAAEETTTPSLLDPYEPRVTASPASRADSESTPDTPPSNVMEASKGVEQQAAREDPAPANADAASRAPLTAPAEENAAQEDEENTRDGVGAETISFPRNDITALSEDNSIAKEEASPPAQMVPSDTAGQIPTEVSAVGNDATCAPAAPTEEGARTLDETKSIVLGQTKPTSNATEEHDDAAVDQTVTASQSGLASEQAEEAHDDHRQEAEITKASAESLATVPERMEKDVHELSRVRNEEQARREATPISLHPLTEDAHAGADTFVKSGADETQPQLLPRAKPSEKTRKRRRAPLAGPARPQLLHATVNEGGDSEVTAHRGYAAQKSNELKVRHTATDKEADTRPSSPSTTVPPVTLKEEVREAVEGESDLESEHATDTLDDARVTISATANTQTGSEDRPLPRRVKTEPPADRKANITMAAPLSPSSPTTIAERAAMAVVSDADHTGRWAPSSTRESTSAASEDNATAPPTKSALDDDTEATDTKRAAPASVSSSSPVPSPASPAPHSFPAPPSAPADAPNTASAPSSTKPVLNIAGVNVQALLAENPDPPPLYFRRQRRTRRKSVLTQENSIFAEHRDLCRHDQTHRVIARAPFASDADVLNSLVEWTDSPALVYARLLWRCAPQPFLHAAMYGFSPAVHLKKETKPHAVDEAASRKKREGEGRGRRRTDAGGVNTDAARDPSGQQVEDMTAQRCCSFFFSSCETHRGFV